MGEQRAQGKGGLLTGFASGCVDPVVQAGQPPALLPAATAVFKKQQPPGFE